MKIRSGKLDRQITVKREAETVSASGAVSKTWATVQSVRAEKIEHTAEEYQATFGNADAGKVAFRVRYLWDIILADRISFDGQEYDLESISGLGRRHGHELCGVLVQ